MSNSRWELTILFFQVIFVLLWGYLSVTSKIQLQDSRRNAFAIPKYRTRRTSREEAEAEAEDGENHHFVVFFSPPCHTSCYPAIKREREIERGTCHVALVVAGRWTSQRVKLCGEGRGRVTHPHALPYRPQAKPSPLLLPFVLFCHVNAAFKQTNNQSIRPPPEVKRMGK